MLKNIIERTLLCINRSSKGKRGDNYDKFQ